MDIQVTVALPPTLTDDEVHYVAARVQDALNKVELRSLACQIHADLFLRGSNSPEPIGILAQADGANA